MNLRKAFWTLYGQLNRLVSPLLFWRAIRARERERVIAALCSHDVNTVTACLKNWKLDPEWVRSLIR